jgi:CRISPR-associated protein Csm5
MSKYRLTLLSPLHISSGNEFEINFNALYRDKFIYLYDEFSIVEFFIAHDILVPQNFDSLKKIIKKNSDKIINSNLHFRRVETNFSNFSKPIFEQVNTAYSPIVAGSSIKGSLRTAILNCLTNLDDCNNLKQDFKDKKFDKQRFQKRFDNDLATLFKYLKVSDSSSILKTKIYKTINVKKEKLHQKTRDNRTEEISNYVEAIEPKQSFEIEIKDISDEQIFKKLGIVCNKFYIPFLGEDEKAYFSKSGYLKNQIKKLSNDIFIINVGRFGGAEQKSINKIREIKGVKEYDKSETTARTFALEKSIQDRVYFEDELLPFGWILCEKIETTLSTKINIEESQKYRFDAIDNIHKLQDKKIKEQEDKILDKAKKEKEEQEEKAKREAQEKDKLASMSPLEQKIEKLAKKEPNVPKITLLLKAIKNGDFDEEKCDALNILKKLMKENKKWKETSTKKKPERDKDYKWTLEVMKIIKNCR